MGDFDIADTQVPIKAANVGLVVILWILLPFAIIGTKNRLEVMLDLQAKTVNETVMLKQQIQWIQLDYIDKEDESTEDDY